VKEGVSICGFNTALITRGMSEIGLQQALGRVQRLDRNNPLKDTCFLYLFVDCDDGDQLKKKALSMAEKIHYGIGDWQVSWESLDDSRVGAKVKKVGGPPNVGALAPGLLAGMAKVVEQVRDHTEYLTMMAELAEARQVYQDMAVIETSEEDEVAF
jgi:hypothetical protein